MKKIIFILFCLIFIAVYPCKPIMIDYLTEANILKDSKNLILYEDSRENFNTNLIFKLGNKLYIYGEEFLKVNEKTYEYLGNGYYKNNNIIYFFENKVTKIKNSDKIKTYVKTKEVESFKGTSCDGQFSDYSYFLEINNKKYENGEKKVNFFISLLNKLFRIIKS